MSSIDCEQARLMMHLRLDGELQAEDELRLQDHLADCAGCRHIDEQLRSIDAALREGLAALEVAPSPQLAARIHDRLGRTRTVKNTWVRWLAAAAALLVATTVLLLAPQRLRPQQQAAPAVVVSGGDGIHVFAPNQRTAQPWHTGAPLQEQAVAWSTSDAAIALEFANGARVTLGNEAVIRVRHNSIALFKGSLHVDLTNAEGSFTVATPWGDMTAQEAVFAVNSAVDGDTADLSVFAGEVVVVRGSTTTTVSAGRHIKLRPDPESVRIL